MSAAIIVLDLETSGLDPMEARILEFGAVALGADLEPIDDEGGPAEFQVDVRWDGSGFWCHKAAEVNGLTREECMDHDLVAEHEALAMFFRWVERVRGVRRVMVAGMNPQFDHGFLTAAARRAWRRRDYSDLPERLRMLVSHRMLDMHSLGVARAIRQGTADLHRLHTDGIYEMLGMEPEPKPHRALTGARMEAEAIRRLMGMGSAVEGGAA
jgi:DNA polymerase III epsilon subunit-like protein